ncbi:ribulose-1,5 bisphosphate carboxylase/oxygenase large subunit N-methyltransferase, chloroplastic isoform X3 [Aristolochia californica]|uniref:ribulose-1,5 bisphosphate carboxylase/oxygenase large subunit N-methyltransferase, chloroplastic isoform X3 n=1 Tax=Aristolochia californica TaxID=171875 RepID=UPI0035DF6B8E
MNKDGITLFLPPLSEKDPLMAKKQKVLQARSISLEFQISFSGSKCEEEASQVLDKMVQAARVLYLDELELYFAEADDSGPFSPRNELESLNLVLDVLSSSCQNTTNEKQQILHMLADRVLEVIDSFGVKHTEEMMIQEDKSDVEDALWKWGEQNGVRTKLRIAYYEGAGRGAAAVEDINIGEVALEVPESILISEEILSESDMFQVLINIDGMTSETMLLLWSMKERYNPNSRFRTYFNSLPQEFNTGLSFGINALSVLEGTLLFEEILQARQHLHEQYEAICPTLCSSYPDIFQSALYTWDQFLWACELWYSNSMKVVFTDSKLRMCLVPIAGLLNHSLCPHILHYGKVDPASKSLKFTLSRPCKEGKQCYLSYGSYSGSHLVTFYGFLPKGENPYDVIPLDIDASKGEDLPTEATTSGSDWTTHMVRKPGPFKKNGHYGLPPPLLAHLRAALQEDIIILHPVIPNSAIINEENEREVLETLISIFNPMMERLNDSECLDSWDVKLAQDFKNLQQKIISSVIAACSAGLEMGDHL